MGLFNRGKQNCDICGSDIGLWKMKCLDGVICRECHAKQYEITKYLLSNKLTLNQIREYFDFVPTRMISNFFMIDEKEKRWMVSCEGAKNSERPKIYSFSDISSYELIENDEVITRNAYWMHNELISKKRINKLYIKITVNDFDNPVVMIKIIDKPINKLAYKSAFDNAHKILSLIELMFKQVNSSEEKKEFSNQYIYCRKCGNKLDLNSLFCNKCGEKI